MNSLLYEALLIVEDVLSTNNYYRSANATSLELFTVILQAFSTGDGGIAETSSGTDDRGRSRTGTIVGGVIGGLLSLILLSAIIIVCLWFGRKKVAEQKAFKGKKATSSSSPVAQK